MSSLFETNSPWVRFCRSEPRRFIGCVVSDGHHELYLSKGQVLERESNIKVPEKTIKVIFKDRQGQTKASFNIEDVTLEDAKTELTRSLAILHRQIDMAQAQARARKLGVRVPA